MGQVAQIIVSGGRASRGYAERLLAGVTPAQFARKASPGGKVIDSNHPAWVYGHLATYPARVASMVGLDGSRLAAPAGFEDLFKDGTECKDDASGTIYPSMEIIVGAFMKGHDGLLDMLAEVKDEVLLSPTTDEKVRQRFPILGGRVSFMCNNHVTMHLGQVSAWRRCMGLPSA